MFIPEESHRQRQLTENHVTLKTSKTDHATLTSPVCSDLPTAPNKIKLWVDEFLRGMT